MKLLLLKILLQRRAKDEGFTLPMVIAIGLVMLLLGTVNIVKSNEENITAINTNSSSDALAIAEVGVARYRELLNQNRILSIYNHDQWTSSAVPVDYLGDGTIVNIDVAGQTCSNLANTPAGWFDDSDNTTNVPPNNTNQWWEVKQNLADDSIGEYRLVSYEYDIDGRSIREDEDGDGSVDDATPNDENGQFAPDDDNANTTDSFTYNDTAYNAATAPNGYRTRGILTVQGRSADGSEAQIEVEIPLRINDIEEFAPVLWIGSGAIGTPGTIDIVDADDNIVLSNSGGGCTKPADISGQNAIRDARDLPSIQQIINKLSAAATTQINTTYAANDYFGKTGDAKYITGVTGDECEKANDYCYLYQLADLTIAGDAEVDGVSNVTVYTPGTVTVNAGSNIEIGSSASSDYFELYVDNGSAITINTGGNNVKITGLIHAPTSTLTVNGGGTLEVHGAIWVNSLVNNDSSTVEIDGDSSSITVGVTQPAYKLYTTSEFRTPRPVTGNPTNWVKEEVD